MQHSTGYIIGFCAAVCVVCAFFVASSAVSLKPLQVQNALLDKQKNVLTVAGLMKPGEKLSAEEMQRRFEESITPRLVDMQTGEYVEGDAHAYDQHKAAKDPATSRRAPENPSKVMRVPNHGLVYEVVENGELAEVIIPIQGYGLWSVLHGYLALDADGNTVRGITYYEHGETAGLGGEVDNPRWKARWPGRKVYDERGNVKLKVRKGPAGPPAEDPYQVDGLSGATLTSNGVTNMMRFWLGKDGYGPFLEGLHEKKGS